MVRSVLSDYSEEELAEILFDTFEDETDIALEVQLTNLLILADLGNYVRYCDPDYVDRLCASMEFTPSAYRVGSMIKRRIGNTASAAILGSTKALRFVSERTGTLLEQLENSRKKKTLSDAFIRKRFYKFENYWERARDFDKCMVKNAAEYETIRSRLDGLQNMCDRVEEMASSASDDSFASDRVWDEFAQMSNTVAKADDPKPGSVFRNFRWITPYTKSFDFKKSKWNNRAAVKELQNDILKVRDDAFSKLVNAANHIKKLAGNSRSEVQHVRDDNLQDMTLEYKRKYLLTKFVQSLQKLILQEINVFVTTGINRLGSFDRRNVDEPEDNDTESEKDKREDKEDKED